MPVAVARWTRELIFNLEIARSNPGLRIFLSFFLLFFLFFLDIQMFFYSIMKHFITLLENVNKSRTSAGSRSLKEVGNPYDQDESDATDVLKDRPPLTTVCNPLTQI
jgi:hypothetical protein